MKFITDKELLDLQAKHQGIAIENLRIIANEIEKRVWREKLDEIKQLEARIDRINSAWAKSIEDANQQRCIALCKS